MIDNRQRTMLADPLDLFAQRDAILSKHQARELAHWLRWEVYLVSRQTGRPVSANDCRTILEAHGFGGIDTNFLSGVFTATYWVETGRVHSTSPGGHARKINTYRPRRVPPEVARPRWP